MKHLKTSILEGLNEEAIALANAISANFKEMVK
jgi:hypothetical protein